MRKAQYTELAATVADRDAWVDALKAAAKGPTSQKLSEQEWHGDDDHAMSAVGTSSALMNGGLAWWRRFLV